MKRIIALAVSFFVCVSSSYAWNAESFIGSENIVPYQDEVTPSPAVKNQLALAPIGSIREPVYAVKSDTAVMSVDAVPAAVAVDDTSVTAAGEVLKSISNREFVSALYPEFTSLCAVSQVLHETPPDTLLPMSMLNYYSTPYGGSSFTRSIYDHPNGLYYQFLDTSRNLSFSSYDENALSGNWVDTFKGVIGATSEYPFHASTYTGSYFTFTLDLSSFPSFTTFELDGLLNFEVQLNTSTSVVLSVPAESVSLVVNGRGVHNFDVVNKTVDFASFIYTSSEVVTSVQFIVYHSPGNLTSLSSGWIRYIIVPPSLAPVSFSILDDNLILDGFNNEGQDAINDLNSLEADWTGQMNSNFHALNISNVTYPNGLISGLGLITGIFNDFWNILGDFNFVYTFPLLLGIALVVIGRLSKFAGGQSSSKEDRGDSSA